MNINTIVVGAFDVNCFILDLDSRSAVIIDPGSDADRISAFIKDSKLVPSAYLLTHGHFDHITGLKALYDEFPAPVAIHENDASWAFTPNNQMLPYYTAPDSPKQIDILLGKSQSIPDLGTQCNVLYTPGHTPGSVCFYFPEHAILFTGDTLFAGSAGRTDLPGGSSRALKNSLTSLKLLPEETRVFPGHGPASTIGHEKRTNYFMQN